MTKKTPPRLTYERLIHQHMKILKNLQYESGLFAASSKAVGTGYDKSWLRDNFYECMAFDILGDWDVVEKTYDALLSIFLKHEWKIDIAIKNKPQAKHEYLHARYNHETFDEFWEEWGNKQNDSVGAILFMIGELEHHHRRLILKNDDHIRIVNKLVQYLASVEYWHDTDHGIWEFDEEVHSSSIGACLAGLKSVKRLKDIDVPDFMIVNGELALGRLLPRESEKNFVDLAQLSLIWPYNVVSVGQRNEILKNVEYYLVKERGVVRFKNDWYYNANVDGYSEDAEWSFGLSWLAIIYAKLGNKDKAQEYVERMIKYVKHDGVPELYFANSPKTNDNTPLGWAESLFVVALHEMNEKFLMPVHKAMQKHDYHRKYS